MIHFFKRHPKILATMSEKKDGSMRLFHNGLLDKKTAKNRAIFFTKAKIKSDSVVSAYLVNGTKIKIIRNNNKKIISATDVLITKKEGLFIAISAGDCIPMLFYEPKARVVGIAHAGWKGVIKNIVKKTIKKMVKIGGRPRNMLVAMGTGINACHFCIKQDTEKMFKEYADFVFKRNEIISVDLKGIIQKQLLKCGVSQKNFENQNQCTFCNRKKYFSSRRDKSKTGLMIALIGMVDKKYGH